MYRKPSKQTLLLRRIMTYVVMVVSIVVIVGLVLLFVLGYRFNSEKGLEQGALLQFNTQPTGALVTVDGVAVSARTPSKSTVLAGTHNVTMKRTGYEDWAKTVNLSAGTLTWLDYALLIPRNRPVETLAAYDSLADATAAPNNRTMLLQRKADTPDFDLVDLRSVQLKSTAVTLPADIYSQAGVEGVTHSFALKRWDNNGRFVLVNHGYADQTEWIVLDTQNPANSKNITRTLDVALSDVVFSGTSGNVFYGLADGTIRKLDLSADTLSRPLAMNVLSFELYDTNIISYIGTNAKDPAKFDAGLYQDGDDATHILKTVDSLDGLRIALTRYFNDDYVAISAGKEVSILKGTFPHGDQEATTLAAFDAFHFNEVATTMNFSDGGAYLFVQSGPVYGSFDIEHQRTAFANLGDAKIDQPLRWLDSSNLYADYDGQLTIREFDGLNGHTINTLSTGYDATLSPNGRFLYSIGKNTTGLPTLQRVKMILE